MVIPIQVTLVDPTGRASTETDADALQEIIQAHATPQHGLEHLRAAAVPTGVALVLFISADGPDEAVAKAAGLLDSSLGSNASGA